MSSLSSSTALPELPPVEKLSGSVVRILGGNPGKFQLQGTNTYLLGTSPDSLILIDAAEGFSQWKDELSSYLQSNKLTVKTCLLTHWHHDHIKGLPGLMDISPRTQVHKNQANSYDPDGLLTNFTVQGIENGQRFDDGHGFEIEALHCPGHAKDHMAFIITKSTFPEEIGRIFTGDNVLGHGTAVFEDLAIYLKSLALMKSRIIQELQTQNITGSVHAYPGHGAVLEDAVAKIGEYITHRKTREDEALNVLKFGSVKPTDQKVDSREWAPIDMVKIIYKDYPEALHVPAQMGLVQVLDKLKGEGRVVKTGDDKWRVVEKSAL